MAYYLDSGLAIALNNTPTTATHLSGGTAGSTSVTISAINNNIAYDQTVTGSGFAPNTKVTGVDGDTISFSPAAIGNITGVITFSTTWYKLTDHNRQAIEISPQLIEKESRMANGTMRKFVVAQKDTISTSWEFLPANDTTRITSALTSGGGIGSTSLVVPYVPASARIGQRIAANGLLENTIITNISGNTISFSPAAITNVTGDLTFFVDDLHLLVDHHTSSSDISDKKYSSSWLSSFYKANAGLPIYIKISISGHDDEDISAGSIPDDSSYSTAKNTAKIYNVFITNFSRTISKRTRETDYVDMSIEFTEV